MEIAGGKASLVILREAPEGWARSTRHFTEFILSGAEGFRASAQGDMSL
jgi:hypothetical protein